jgi:hypothetical protein
VHEDVERAQLRVDVGAEAEELDAVGDAQPRDELVQLGLVVGLAEQGVADDPRTGSSGKTSAKASRNTCWPFQGVMRPSIPTTATSSRTGAGSAMSGTGNGRMS